MRDFAGSGRIGLSRGHRLVGAAVVVALGLAAAPSARAALGDFQYGSLATLSPINPSATVGGPGSQISQAGVGNFTTPTVPTFNALNAGGTDITVGTVTITDLALGAPYTDTYNSPITVNLKIKDVSSGLTGTFTLTGTLTGTVASNGTTTAAFFGNDPFTGTQPVSERIGSALYTVSAVPGKDFASPGSPPAGGSGIPGTYSLHVTATLPTAAIDPVPEPGSVVLLGLGCLGATGLFRRRRRAAA